MKVDINSTHFPLFKRCSHLKKKAKAKSFLFFIQSSKRPDGFLFKMKLFKIVFVFICTVIVDYNSLNKTDKDCKIDEQ